MKKSNENIIFTDSELIEVALGNLRQYTGIDEAELIIPESGDDVYVMQILKNKMTCRVKPVMNSVTVMDLAHDTVKSRGNRDSVTIFRTSTPAMRKRCTELGINYLDTAGNCHIASPSSGTYIHVDGIPSLMKERKNGLSIRSQGLRVLLYLSTLKNNMLPLYKDIARASHVSMGTVKNVVDGLMDGGYLLKSDRGLFLKNRIRLLETWSTLYNQSQRDKMLLGKMSWRTDKQSWQNIELPEGFFWGGECGAYLLNKYMTPASFCLYSTAPASTLVKEGIMLPDPNGEIQVYKTFWNDEVSKSVPPAMLFADLVELGDGRSLEAAKYLKEHDLQYLI